MLALMQGKKRLQVRDSNQHGGGGLYVEDIPRFVDNESLIPPLARTKSQAPGKHSLRSKSMPIKDRTLVKHRIAGEPPSPHEHMVIPPAPERRTPGAPPRASSRSSRVASLGPPPENAPPVPPASAQLPSPRGSASQDSSMPRPRGSAHSLEPPYPLGGDSEAPKGMVAKAAAKVQRKVSRSKSNHMPEECVNNRREVRSIDKPQPSPHHEQRVA